MRLTSIGIRILKKIWSQMPSIISTLALLFGAPLLKHIPEIFNKPFVSEQPSSTSVNIIGSSAQQLEEKCVSISNEDENWDKKRYSNKSGYWTPKSGFVDPVMWYVPGLNPNNVKKITIVYILNKITKNPEKPTSLVIEYARKQEKKDPLPIFKSWTPEGENDQIWRFSKNEDFTQDKLSPETATDLTDPVKLQQTDVMTIRPVVVSDNEVTFNFTYQYTSREINKVIPDSISKTVIMPTSRLRETEEIFMLGVGTYIGHGIKIEKVEICK